MGAVVRELERSRAGAYRHEAFFYEGEAGFVEGTAPFVRASLAADEPVLVLVGQPKIDLLRSELGSDASRVHFADMAEVGRNPARIIPAWQAFLDKHAAAGQRVRGIGEPVWAARTPAELVECQRHEALLNIAIPDTLPLWLLCPYDRSALSTPVLQEARRSHPYVAAEGASLLHDPQAMAVDHLRDPLQEPTRVFGELAFGPQQLGLVRRMVAAAAERFGLGADRTDDLVIAANEIATNSLTHGGGDGSFRLWRDGRSLVCEITDAGCIDDALAGRQPPPADQPSGRGLWMANQLCDLVQIRSHPTGSVVRLHMALHG